MKLQWHISGVIVLSYIDSLNVFTQYQGKIPAAKGRMLFAESRSKDKDQGYLLIIWVNFLSDTKVSDKKLYKLYFVKYLCHFTTRSEQI